MPARGCKEELSPAACVEFRSPDEFPWPPSICIFTYYCADIDISSYICEDCEKYAKMTIIKAENFIDLPMCRV